MKKFLTPKKIILAFIALFGIYLLGIPLYYTPYELQPSYWKFKEICEATFQLHNQHIEHTQRIKPLMQIFNVDNQKIKKYAKLENNTYISRIPYPHFLMRIENAQLNIYSDLNWNIIKIDTGDLVWYNWRPMILGNEGNMDLRVKWNNFLMCGNLDKRIEYEQ
ncbi:MULTISPECIES: hypothetical protein [Campylobacter]|uniref:Uncharacterized protein n=1 Tax=Campylobacter jejuni TaxID=197 RepID=A0A1E7NI21_CAMJU|nr:MULTISPECIES: hypothetical protein [Campylobacter]EGK8183234.1 hypothetical protein [Campylobacter coli]EAI3389622.1 hypothetical protein [Campylobacter jejuni]EAL2422074.1 hypothetical protein [Campylobacter jejuni]EAL7805625.1 hypothetical protein [Campylobacter jejuni]ECL3538109.1 hypothetical protein [Campylobacter jejuni]